MAWNKDIPQSNDLIADSQSDVLGNFQAIEAGDVPGERWQFFNGNPPSSAIANTFQVYSKDVSSKAELHGRDEDDNEIQLTSAGRLGSSSTNATFNNIRIASGTTDNTQDSFVSAWALVAADGSLTSGFGLTSAKNSTGDYTLTFSTAAADANYVVVGNVFKSNTRARVLWTYSKSPGSFSVRTQAINASAGSYEDNIFMVAVMGAR